MTFLIAILYQSFVPEENSHIVNGTVGFIGRQKTFGTEFPAM